MRPDSLPPGGAALRDYQGFRYTVVTMATGGKPNPVEAELWYALLDASGKVGRWTYFRRYVSARLVTPSSGLRWSLRNG